MTTSEAINEIAAAGAKAQAELQPAVKDSVNPHFRSRYANEAAVREASRVYAKHGIAVWQEPTTTETSVAVITLLTHTSGQWIKFDPFTVPLSKQDAQGVGSATTYAKRYSLSTALGIAAEEDDDGNAASESHGVDARTFMTPTEAQKPPKYDEHWTDLTAAADEGTAAFDKAWAGMSGAFKNYTIEHRQDQRNALRVKAAQATQAAKEKK